MLLAYCALSSDAAPTLNVGLRADASDSEHVSTNQKLNAFPFQHFKHINTLSIG